MVVKMSRMELNECYKSYYQSKNEKEVIHAMRMLKNGKAMNIDDVTEEMLNMHTVHIVYF